MRPLKSLAICMVICAFMLSLMAAPALADGGWGDEPLQKGKPDEPPIQSVGPAYYGQPMMLDGRPWADDPPKNGRPEFEVSPTVGPYAWWMQPALDGHTWGEDPPKGKEPQTP